METLFDPVACQNVLRRVDALRPESQRQWGKMTAAQMCEHVARALAMAVGKAPSTQRFLGKMIGWMFKPGFVGPKPFPKNSPTGPDFVIKGEPDFDATKARVKALVSESHVLGEQGCDGNIHGFFGKLTGAEWGVTQYKHLDHHLRQFGV
jgi:hypothetical protein